MKLFGIIGKPLNHTLSPKIFSAVFRKLSLSHRYLPFQIEKVHLKNLILCMKLVGVEGLNVTAPYKEAVIPFLDRLDATAKQSGAVNAIVRRNNCFVGFNTDGAGLLEALKEKNGFDPKNKSVIIIGAGGAARGIAAALADAGVAHVSLVNRHAEKAKRAAAFFRKKFPKTKWQVSLPDFAKADLLVQASSVSLLFPLERLPKSAIVCDIIYSFRKTKLLAYAEKLGLSTLDGLWMLCYQARLSLKLWTGANIDPAWMRKRCQ